MICCEPNRAISESFRRRLTPPAPVTEKLSLRVLLVVSLALVGYALTVPVAAHKGSFFSDEATYYAMTYSLAFDADIRYEGHDLEYVYDRGYEAGPAGIFLRREEATGRLYYAKAFIYPLAAAPFVRLAGDNGFLLLHALLLVAVLLAGYAYLKRTLEPQAAVAWVLAYFLGSIAFLYYFWITPEIFNMSVGFLATFLWLYKERPPGYPADAPWEPSGALAGGWTNFAAAALYGVAAYSKPPYIILLGPLLAWMLLRGRLKQAVALGVAAAVVVVALFAVTDMSTGDWNYMGGDRRSFGGPYPFQYRDRTFQNSGTNMTTEVSDYKDRFPRPDHLAADLLAYLWVGRNAGLLIYMLPAVLAMIAFAANTHRRWRSPHTLLIGATAATALALMTVIQANWIGGGGAIGSRYFIGLYYAPFFAIPAGTALLGPVISWVVWTLFLSQIVLTPFTSSRAPGRHTQHMPFTLLPPEMGMLNDLPFNTDPLARRVTLREGDTFDIYFLDDNTHKQEGGLPGFWVKSRSRAEIVVRAAAPVEELTVQLTNGPTDNEVSVFIDGRAETVDLEASGHATVVLQPLTRFTFGSNYVYRLVIDSRSGGVPMVHSEASEDFRRLGVFVEPSIR
jgi:hypothetical protein